MQQSFLHKVMLSAYKNLEFAAKENERMVIKRTRFSYCTNKSKNAFQILDEIADKNREKFRLVNLKVLIDKALCLMLKEDRELLEMRFFKGLKFCDIAKKTDVSLRQVFRVYDRAVESFGFQLEYLGYTAERIEREFGDMPIIKTTAVRLADTLGKTL